MKLESFLRESIESTKSWAAISSLDEESAQIVKKVVNAVKTFKFVGEEVENPEDAHDSRGKIHMEFSDGLLDVDVKASTSETDGALEFGYLMCAARVNKNTSLRRRIIAKSLRTSLTSEKVIPSSTRRLLILERSFLSLLTGILT